jgi:glycosyltransferase involved in cell wall biosynthesis
MDSNKISVLHVISDSNIGGAGHHLLDLLDHCDNAVFSLEVALPEGSRLIPALTARGTAFTEVPCLAEQSFSYSAVRELRQIIKGKKPTIVHTHAALSGRVAAWMCGHTAVHTRHTVQAPPSDEKMLFAKRMSQNALRPFLGFVHNTFSDAIIAVSPAARYDLLRTGAMESKIRVIYNGVNPARKFFPEERAACRERYGIPDGVFTVSQIARLTEVKGQGDVLDAVKDITDGSLYLLIAGDGPLLEYLEKRLTEENIQNVKLLGFVEDVDELISITDVQVNASYGSEATSLALLKGMSAGVPAVASNYGGNPYVITHGENGFIVPQKDPAALREALLMIKDNKTLYRRLSEGAKRIYRERFTVKDMITQVETLYKELAERKALYGKT